MFDGQKQSLYENYAPKESHLELLTNDNKLRSVRYIN